MNHGPTILAAQQGDPDAFAQLVRRYAPLVRATALSVMANLEASDDVAQQAFVQAWRRLSELREPAAFGSWIRQITRNLALTQLRGRQRYRARVAPDGGQIEAAASEAPDAESRLLAREEQAVLEVALSRLDEEDRTVLVLYHLHDASSEEVAALLGISAAAVRKRLSRARHRLAGAVETRLHDVLGERRTDRSFVAGVLGLIGARSATSTARWALAAGAALAGALAIGWIGWFGWTPGGTVGATGSSSERPAVHAAGPAETRRARAASPPAPVAAPPAAPVNTTPYVLEVNLEDVRRYHGAAMMGRPVGAEPFFPTPEEAPLPEAATTQFLQELLDLDEDRLVPPDGLEAALFAAAEAEGLVLDAPDVLSDPWRALTALEVAHRRVRFDHKRAMRTWFEAFDDHGPPEGVPRPDAAYREAEAFGRAVLARYPEAPEADFARMYLLDPLLEDMSEVFDVAAGVATAVDILVETEDAWVRDAAARRLGEAFGPVSIEEADRRVLEPLLEELRGDLRHRLAAVLTRAALLDGAFDEARRLNVRHRAAVEALCPGWPAVNPPQGPIENLRQVECSFWGQEADEIDGRLAAVQRGPTPEGWRAALIAAAWRCHVAHPGADDNRVTLTASPSAWSPGAWGRPEGRFTACMDASWTSLPTASPGQVVELWLSRR